MRSRCSSLTATSTQSQLRIKQSSPRRVQDVNPIGNSCCGLSCAPGAAKSSSELIFYARECFMAAHTHTLHRQACQEAICQISHEESHISNPRRCQQLAQQYISNLMEHRDAGLQWPTGLINKHAHNIGCIRWIAVKHPSQHVLIISTAPTTLGFPHA